LNRYNDIDDMVSKTEKDLIQRLKNGDISAFDCIFREYRPRLFGFLVRLSKDRELSEDISQEVWLRLALKAQALDDDTRLGPWLFTVARNLFISYCRRILSGKNSFFDLDSTHMKKENNPSPFEKTALNEEEKMLEGAIAQLPRKYREILLLVAVEGITTEEAALICSIKPPAARKRLSRARAMITDIIERKIKNEEV